MTLLETIASYPPDRIALQDGRQVLTYGALRKAVDQKAQALASVRCAALALDNGIDWVIWDLAAMQSGTVIVPLPPFFSIAQTDHAVNAAGCDAVIAADGIIPLQNPAAVLPEGTAKITFTSGTTGKPKGVCLPLAAMEQVARSIGSVLGPSYAGRHCSVMPLGVLLENVAGVYAALLAGGEVMLPSLTAYGHDYGNLHAVLREMNATSIILVPEILRLLMGQVAALGPLPDLTFIAVGGSKVAPQLIAAAHAMHLPVYEGYGLSECASVVSLNTPHQTRAGSVGTILPHIDVNIIDDEIVVENPAFLGYVGEVRAGPFATGDIGRISDEGYLHVTGRKKNIIITSYGRNIAPEWIESLLLAQPDIIQAIVHGDGCPYPEALIVSQASDADLQKAIARVNESLPPYARIADYKRVSPFNRNDGTLTGTGRPRRSQILQLHRKENTR